MSIIILNYCDLFFDALDCIFQKLLVDPTIHHVKEKSELDYRALDECEYLFSYRHSIESHDIKDIHQFDHPSKKVIFYVFGGSDFDGTPKEIDGVAYLPMGAPREQLFNALHNVFFPNLKSPHHLDGVAPLPRDCSIERRNTVFNGFTSRQRDIIGMLLEGKNNKEISCALCISGNTVKTHISNVFKLLGVSSRAQAVAVFRSAPGPQVENESLAKNVPPSRLAS